MDNIKAFNLITGKLFADLYQKFPAQTEVDFFSLALDLIPKEDFDSAWEKPAFAEATVRWLDQAGYIWLKKAPTMNGKPTAVLSPKGLEALKAVPESIDGKLSLGERIINFSKTKASESLNQAVGLAITAGFQLMTKST